MTVPVTVKSGDDPWIVGAALLTALATIALAVIAVCQIRAGRQQAADARTQADAAIAASKDQADTAIAASKDQAQEAQRQAAQTIAITREQADAAIKIARETRETAQAGLEIATATREAAQRQWQPRVFARKWGAPERGNGLNAARDEMAVPCYLVNEGTGPAFNVELALEVAGELHPSHQWWAMQAQEFFPPLDADAKQPVPSKPIYVGVRLEDWKDGDYVYVARFENLLEERFEVRTYPDTNRPSEFRPL